MVSCSACGEQNANKNYFCASCGGRIRPVGRRLEQDVLAVIAKHRRKNRARNVVVAGLILGVLGFFGYGWVKQKIATTVAGQIEAMKPAIVKEAHSKAEEVFSRELPKVMAQAASDATHNLVADLRQVGEQRQREIEEIYENGKREAASRTQQLAATYNNNSTYGALTPMSASASLISSNSTLQDSVNTLRGFPISDAGLGTPVLGASPEMIKMLNTTASAFQITASSATITTQTAIEPGCLGGVTFVPDASGALSLKPADCKDNLTGLTGLNGRPIQ